MTEPVAVWFERRGEETVIAMNYGGKNVCRMPATEKDKVKYSKQWKQFRESVGLKWVPKETLKLVNKTKSVYETPFRPKIRQQDD